MQRLAIRSRRGAYVALVVLTVVWGFNWVALKLAMQHADPIVFNIQRILVAIAVLFSLMLWQGKSLAPNSWIAIIVTGFFQTTINFGSTTMAVFTGGAGRASVLVFTMPFWTLLLAWPVLGERVRGGQWIAVLLALTGLTIVVEPWNWHDAILPKLWAVLSGFGWAAGTIATKYFQRDKHLDMLNFIGWQMIVGVLPFLLLPFIRDTPPVDWSPVYVAMLAYSGAIATGFGFVLWIAVLRFLPAGTAALNMLAIPAIALVSSMMIFDERLNATEWAGIGLIALGLVIISLLAWIRARRGQGESPQTPVIESG
ncbi:MAG: DMT family transporter [Pseudomonadota bacterium]|nr:DMT family transporter [Pseudomonadota bacterium]